MANLKTPLMSAILGFSFLASGSALAGGALNCPAGTVQKGAPGAGTGIVSCVDANGLSQGPYLGYDDAGNLRARGTMKDSKAEGKTTFYDAQGQKTGETEYRASRYHGKRVVFFADGRVKSEMNFRNGRLDGKVQKFNAQGNLVRASNYEAGRRVASR